MPEGPRRSLSRVSPARIVCPALLPPWQRTTRSEARARRSVAFPLPSSPHWVPTRIVTGTVGFYPARPCAPCLVRPRRILTGISAVSVGTFSKPEYGHPDTAGNTATKGDGDHGARGNDRGLVADHGAARWTGDGQLADLCLGPGRRAGGRTGARNGSGGRAAGGPANRGLAGRAPEHLPQDHVQDAALAIVVDL